VPSAKCKCGRAGAYWSWRLKAEARLRLQRPRPRPQYPVISDGWVLQAAAAGLALALVAPGLRAQGAGRRAGAGRLLSPRAVQRAPPRFWCGGPNGGTRGGAPKCFPTRDPTSPSPHLAFPPSEAARSVFRQLPTTDSVCFGGLCRTVLRSRCRVNREVDRQGLRTSTPCHECHSIGWSYLWLGTKPRRR
jgi:hypothetical protein